MLLIDGDRAAYTTAFVIEKLDPPKEGNQVKLTNFHKGIVDGHISNVFELYNDKEYEMYLTSQDKSNFRFKLAKTRPYKGYRDKKKKPTYLKPIRDYLIADYGAQVVSGMEADDALGIRQTELLKDNDFRDVILISDDKDLHQIVGLHGDFKGNITECKDNLGHLDLVQRPNKRWVLKGTGLRFFYAQVLMGDRCDDVPGLHRYGDVKTYQTLKDCQDEKQLYKAALAAYNGDTTLMDEMASLVWILKEKDVYWVDHKRQMG